MVSILIMTWPRFFEVGQTNGIISIRMNGLFLILVTFYCVFQTVSGECKDVDQTACKVFHVQNSTMCQNKCLAKMCQATCGVCPLTCYHCDNVARPEDCQTTIQCSSISELCIATQRFSLGLQQPTYSSGCVGKAVCDTLFGTKGAGKRSYSLHGGCCSKNLCNIHDPDGVNITSDATEEQIDVEEMTIDEKKQDDPASVDISRRDAITDPDICADFDVNNLACGLLKKADANVCKDDCIGRLICPVTCGTCVHCKNCMDVDDVNLCKNFTLCKKTQSCFAKEALRKDFTVGIDLQCMDDFICHAYFGGITNSNRKRQFGGSMRLSGMCCKTNGCNANGVMRPTAATGK